MKKGILFSLCLVLLQVQGALAISHVITDSISYLKIAELEYKDGQLFLLEHVKPVKDKDYEAHRLTLSAQEREQFLQLVKELKLLDMQPNDNKKTTPPFEIEFVKNGKPGKVSAYKNGMCEAEKTSLDRYIWRLPQTINRRSNLKTLLTSFPDGEYRVKDWKRYAVAIGPKGWTPWEKSGDTIKTDDPVYVLNGKVIDPEKNVLEDIAPQDIESIEVLNDAEVIKTYGEQAKHGVVIIVTKKKN